MPTNPILDMAERMVECGLSVVPIRPDASKRPTIPWQEFQSRRPTAAELRSWFPVGTRCGLAVVNGAVSGNLVSLDFDLPGLLEDYLAACAEAGVGGLLDALPIALTPSGGAHVYWRCEEAQGGNRKLATRPVPGAEGQDGARRYLGGWCVAECMIETRAEGGYAIVPPTPAWCHPDGREYSYLSEIDLPLVPTLTGAQQSILLGLAETFNEWVEPVRVVSDPRPRQPSDGVRPGDDYSARGLAAVEAVLEADGWTRGRPRGDTQEWWRPGKRGGHCSATTNHAGAGLFYVFSSNAHPFEPMHAYTPFSVYALLRHGGDFAAAAKSLAAEGYGDKRSAPPARGAAPPAGQQGQAAPPPKPAPPAPRKSVRDRIQDWADVPPPPAELPLMFGGYLLEGASHWLTGATGVGKSTVLYNIAGALATGSALWGIGCKPQRILYFDMESGDVGRAMKVQRLHRDWEKPKGRLLFVREAVKLPDELPEVEEVVKSDGITLVIFDTARRCFGVKDENDNAEFYANIVPTLDRFKALGVATLTLGHPSKNGAFGARGAGAQEDAGDINLALRIHKGEITDTDAVLSLSVTKNRLLGLGTPPLLLRRAGHDTFEPMAADTAPNKDTEKLSTLLRCAEVILTFLGSHPAGAASYKAVIDEAVEAGFNRKTAERAHKQLKDENEIIPAHGGGWMLPASNGGAASE